MSNVTEPDYPKRLPDAGNCSPCQQFSVPVNLVRNPNISAKAKVVLSIFLSNNNTWTSYKSRMTNMMKERRSSIAGAFDELKALGYLTRYKYRNKNTGQIIGSFWAYTDTPFEFNLENHLARLEVSELELVKNKNNEVGLEIRQSVFPTVGFPAPKIKNNNNKKSKKERKNPPPSCADAQVTSGGHSFSSGTPGKYSDELLPVQTQPVVLPKDNIIINHWTFQVATLLAETIEQFYEKHTEHRVIVAWAKKLNNYVSESNISKKRIYAAAGWYANHIGEGGRYAIKIRHMNEFCEKFLMVECKVKELDEQDNESSNEVDPHSALRAEWKSITARLKEQAGPMETEERFPCSAHALFYNYWQHDFTRFVKEYTDWMDDNFESKYITPKAFQPTSGMFAAYLKALEEEHGVKLRKKS